MGYKALTMFTDSADGHRLYEKGDKYPKGDFQPPKERFDLLSKPHPAYDNMIFIEKEKSSTKKTDKDSKSKTKE